MTTHPLFLLFQRSNGCVCLYLEPKEYHFLNGITYSGNSNSLFVSSVEGVLKIDILSKKYALLKTIDTIDAKGIDRLAFYKNRLIGYQSSKASAPAGP